MAKGPPIRDRRNNWNDQWLPYMRRIATDVLTRLNEHCLVEDDLVAEAWIQSARRNDANMPCTRMGPSIRRSMWQTVLRWRQRALTLSVDDDEQDWKEPQAEADFVDYDALLDATAVLAEAQNSDLVCMHAMGYTLRDMGERRGICDERCRQLLRDEFGFRQRERNHNGCEHSHHLAQG